MTYWSMIKTRLTAGSLFLQMFFFSIALLAASLTASAQTKPVQLFVKSKEMIPSTMREDELEIREPPGATLSIAATRDSSLCVGILIDTSHSSKYISGPLSEDVLPQIATFLQTRLKKGQDAGFVMSFDSTVTLLQDNSYNPDLLVAALTRLRLSGGTSLHDALIAAAKKLDRAECVRRAVILVSDGDDNQSAATLEQAIRSIQEARSAVFALAFDLEWGRGTRVLSKIAGETGGLLLETYPPMTVAKAFKSLNGLLDNAYFLQVGLPPGFALDKKGTPLKIKLKHGKSSLLYPSTLQ
jgi:hypothetical protein